MSAVHALSLVKAVVETVTNCSSTYATAGADPLLAVPTEKTSFRTVLRSDCSFRRGCAFDNCHRKLPKTNSAASSQKSQKFVSIAPDCKDALCKGVEDGMRLNLQLSHGTAFKFDP